METLKTSPHEAVKRFVLENSSANWKEQLASFTDNFPQIQKGKIAYLVEGGTAVMLHLPNLQRKPFNKPSDIDLVYDPDCLSLNWDLPPFDFNSIISWFELRGLKHTKAREKLLFNRLAKVILGGKEIWILDKIALALSKKLPFNRELQRVKDFYDIQHLGVSHKEMDELYQKILAS